jgi:hypothetical protein
MHDGSGPNSLCEFATSQDQGSCDTRQCERLRQSNPTQSALRNLPRSCGWVKMRGPEPSAYARAKDCCGKVLIAGTASAVRCLAGTGDRGHVSELAADQNRAKRRHADPNF